MNCCQLNQQDRMDISKCLAATNARHYAWNSLLRFFPFMMQPLLVLLGFHKVPLWLALLVRPPALWKQPWKYRGNSSWFSSLYLYFYLCRTMSMCPCVFWVNSWKWCPGYAGKFYAPYMYVCVCACHLHMYIYTYIYVQYISHIYVYLNTNILTYLYS